MNVALSAPQEVALVAPATALRPHLLIVDDHALMRFGLRSILLADLADLEIDEAGCLQDAIELFGATPGIDLVLLDLNMGDCRGLQGLRRFVEAFPRARVVVLSATQDEFVVRQAKALGATAYIAKSAEPAKMSQMIISLLRHDGCDGAPKVAMGVGGITQIGRNSSFDRVAEFGSRHLEILDLVLFGCSNQEISNATHLSLGTVKNYVSTILLALDVKSRSHLISLFR